MPSTFMLFMNVDMLSHTSFIKKCRNREKEIEMCWIPGFIYFYIFYYNHLAPEVRPPLLAAGAPLVASALFC